MKIAVINFSGNVGKTTIARHLLKPRIPQAEFVSIESVNADAGDGDRLRGCQFGMLQEYLQTADNVVVDVGASNVEDMLALMRTYKGSHEDFDYFVVPTVPAVKQQKDTMATLTELAHLGISAERLRLVFNQLDHGVDIMLAFDPLLDFVEHSGLARPRMACKLGVNEIFEKIRGHSADLGQLARDETDYKAQIARAASIEEKVSLARALAIRRLARGVVPELDECFLALELQ